MAELVESVPVEGTATLDTSDLYERDIYSWAMQQAEALRRRDYGAIDWDNVVEEIEDMGKSEQRSWKSTCARVIEHLLKIEYWEPADESHLRHWTHEIDTFRVAMARTIRDSPGLKGQLQEMFRVAWRDGRHDALRALAKYERQAGASATQRKLLRGWDRVLPKECPYSLLEVTALDPRRDSEPRDGWPPDVADVLTHGLGEKHHTIKSTVRHSDRRW